MPDFYGALLREDGRAERLFMFDHKPEPNQLPEQAVVELTPEQHAEWIANLHTRAFRAGELLEVPSDLVVTVPQAVVVARLIEAGKLRQVYAQLQMDAPVTAISDAQLAQREKWRTRTFIRSDDPDEHALLVAIGADPASILAPA